MSKNIDKVWKRKNRCWYDQIMSQYHPDLPRYKKALGTATKTIRNA